MAKGKGKRRPQGHPAKRYAEQRAEQQEVAARRVFAKHTEAIEHMAAERDMTVREMLESIPKDGGRSAAERWLEEHPPVKSRALGDMTQNLFHKSNVAEMRASNDPVQRGVAERLDHDVDKYMEEMADDGRLVRTPDGGYAPAPDEAMIDTLADVVSERDRLFRRKRASLSEMRVPGASEQVAFPPVDMAALHDDTLRQLTRPGDEPPEGTYPVQMAVGGDDPDLVGLVMDPEGEAIVGITPGTPVERWLAEHELRELLERVALPLGGPLLDAQIRAQAYGELGHLLGSRAENVSGELSTHDLTVFVFPNALDGLLEERDGELRDAVSRRIADNVELALENLRSDGMVSRTARGWVPSPTRGASPAMDMVSRMVSGESPEESMRGMGYEPVMKASPQGTDDQRLRELLTAGGGPSVLMDMDTGAVSAPGRSGTVAEAVHEAIITGLRRVSKGWSLAPRGSTPEDVAVTGGARTMVRITGDLADAVYMAGQVTEMDAGDWVREQLGNLVIADKPRGLEFRGAIVQVVHNEDAFPADVIPPGSTPDARMHAVAVAKLARERWPEGEEMGTPLAVPDDCKVSYIGMANLAAGSLSKSYPARVDPQDLTMLDRKAFVHVVYAWRVQHPEHGTLVRLALSLPIREERWEKNQPPTQMALHDVSPVTWEALTGEGPEVSEHATLEEVPDPAEFMRELVPGAVDGRKPVWAGARGFDGVWSRALFMAEWADVAMERGISVAEAARAVGWDVDNELWRWAHNGMAGFSISTLEALETAHEVLLDPDQVNAIADFEGGWEPIVGYAREVPLPFGSVFLDMEGPAKSCAIVRPPHDAESDVVLAVRGAHVTRDEAGRLEVMPYGALVHENDVAINSDKTCNPLGRFVFGVASDQPPRAAMWAQTAVHRNGFVDQHVVVDPASCMSPLPLPHGVREVSAAGWTITSSGTADMGERSGCAAMTTYDATVEVDVANLALQASCLTAAALTALRGLYLLGMGNVELVPAGTRQVRRHAERKGLNIALAIHIQVNRKQYERRADGNGSGTRREYSHRFQRRGSEAHYPVGTRMADARPDLCVPCPRCGRCRRVFRPATIVGPDDKPLVLKSLVLGS